MAKETSQLDAYSYAVMRKLDSNLDEPLSPELRSKLEETLLACKPKTHAVDLRGVLPFHFARLYFVLLMGKDKRHDIIAIEHDNRHKTKFIERVIYWLVNIWPLYVILAFIYFVLTNLPPLFTG